MVWWTNSNFFGKHTLLWQCNLATSKTICGQPAQKESMHTQMEMNKFYSCNRSAMLQSHWSLSLLGNRPKKFDFVHQTISHWEVHMGWRGLPCMLVNCKFTFLFKGTELKSGTMSCMISKKKLNELFPSLFLGALSVSWRCSRTFPCREESWLLQLGGSTHPWLLQLGGSTHPSSS